MFSTQLGYLDMQGSPLPGFWLKDCKPLDEDSTHHLVAFAGKADWKNLSDKRVRLRVEMTLWDLFAMELI